MRCGSSGASPRTRSSSFISIGSISAAEPTGWRLRRAAISASSSRSVTLPQAALLAGLLKAPSRYCADAQRRAGKRPRGCGAGEHGATPDTCRSGKRRAAAAQPFGSAPSATRRDIPIRRLGGRALPEFVGEQRRRPVVETTIDAACSARRSRRSARCSTSEGPELAVREGAVVVLDTAGGVKALVGGRSYRVKPLRPRAEGDAAAWLGLQAVRLSRRA